MIAKLREAHPFTKMLSTASAAIVVCGRPDLQEASAKNSGLRTAAPPLKIFSFRQKTWDMEPAGADVIHLWTG